MTNPRFARLVPLVVLIAVLALAGCHKQVAATPPPPPAPTPPPPAPTITLRAAQSTIDRGQSTSLQWEAKNASSVRIDPEVGDVQGQGTRQVSPTASQTYTATATGPGGTATDSARITVNTPRPPAPPPPPAPPTPTPSIDELFNRNVQTIYFDFDKYDIRPDQVARLESNASWLKENRRVKFTVEGHCDERGSEEYNLALGDRRANAVKDFLLKQGVDASAINVISYGEERPVCREATEDCYSRNRRAAFVISPAS